MIKLARIIKRAFITRKCILCGDVIDYERKDPFCDECEIEWLENMDIMCTRCGFDCDYCNCLPDKVKEISRNLPTFGVFYTPSYSTPVNRLVYIMKREYNKEAIRFCAKVLAKKVIKNCAKNGINYRKFVVTYPARRRKSVAEYGYDHAELLAKEFAKIMHLDFIRAFRNIGKDEQKTLTRIGRLANASSSYELLENVNIDGKKIFIVDDVMTSGATLNICSRMLISGGASLVIPIAFAKDMHIISYN